jgi:hypothetical protein
VVSNVDIVSVDIGTTTRIRVNVEHNEPSILPGQWFVKLPSMAWQAKLITALPRLLHTEVRFYNEVAQSVSVTVPNFLAAQSEFGRGTTLVIEQLAKFHACFWNKGRINNSYPWLAGPVRCLEDFLGAAMAVPLMKRGLHQAGELIPVKLHTSHALCT